MMNSISRRGMYLALLLTGIMTMISTTEAHAGGPGGRGGKGGRDPFAALELTAEQKTRIDAIRAQFGSQTASLRTQMDALRQQMREARQNGDEARIEQLRAEAEPLHTQMKSYHDQMDQQIRAVLTAEQIAKLDEMKAQRGKGKGARGERGGRGEHGGQGAANGGRQIR